MALEMDNSFSGLVMGRLPAIIAKCLNLGILSEEEVEEIENDYFNQYDKVGAVSLFHYFNSLLPPNEQLKFTCSSPIVDSFVLFTEEALSNMFPYINGLISKNMLEKKGSLIVKMFGKPKGQKNLCLLSEFEENQFSTRILKGSIRTDGYELQYLAIDLNSTKKRQKSLTTSNLVGQAKQSQKSKSYEQSELPPDLVKNISNYTLCGIDCGKINALMSTIYPAESEKEKYLYGFKSKALSEPTRRFNYWMKNQKTKISDKDGVDVYALERDLERRENEPMNAYVARWKELYLALSLFYNDLAFK